MASSDGEPILKSLANNKFESLMSNNIVNLSPYHISDFTMPLRRFLIGSCTSQYQNVSLDASLSLALHRALAFFITLTFSIQLIYNSTYIIQPI